MDLVINLDPFVRGENQLVYAKPLQIIKGIDNKIKLLFKNQDQKLQSLLDTTIVFNLIDSTNSELVFTRAVSVYTDKNETDDDGIVKEFNGYTIADEGKFQHLPNFALEREIGYITAPSGACKSYYI
jgi:hypothetical protein